MYTKFLRLHILTDWGSRGSHDLNFSNRPVRTRMPGGVAGAQLQAAPYADFLSRDPVPFLHPLASLHVGSPV